jgi:hypothetical protein
MQKLRHSHKSFARYVRVYLKITIQMKLGIIYILLIITQLNFAQSTSIELSNGTPKYESIVDIIMGPQEWYESSDFDYEAGFQYRIVVTRMEIYETLFIEKLIIDVEGNHTKIEWAKVLNMHLLLKEFGIHPEQQNFNNIEWDQGKCFNAVMDSIPFICKISDDEDYLLINKNE